MAIRDYNINSKPVDFGNNVKTKRSLAVVPRYAPMLYSVLFLLFIDLLINSFSELAISTGHGMIAFYIVQDVCILFSAILILIMLINTYMFQAGLMGYMIGKFKSLWFISALYLAFCIALQVWLIDIRWNDSLNLVWTNPGLIVVYVFQRTFSVLYYYFYKRTAYRLSDPRFYEDSDWLRNEFERRQK